jgi:hypothetical protein
VESKKAALNTAGVVFLIISILQLLRVIFKPEVIVAGNVIPLWPNAIAFALFFLLSLWMFKSNR